MLLSNSIERKADMTTLTAHVSEETKEGHMMSNSYCTVKRNGIKAIILKK
jgi:hypothetical protein